MVSPNPVSQSSFDKNHDLYDIVRPGYPDEAVRASISVANLHPNSTIVDMAAGTGKFTAELQKFLPENVKLVCVEPSPGMVESFHKNFPSIEILQAPASDVPLTDGFADAIFVAQAFHWFASLESLKEFHRLLKPEGMLCLVWNYEDFDALSKESWQYQTVKLFHSFDKDVPQYNHMEWPKVFENQPFFSKPHDLKFPYDKVIPTKEFYWNYWKSRSYITALNQDDLMKVHERFLQILDDSIQPDDLGAHGELTAKRGTHIVYAQRLE